MIKFRSSAQICLFSRKTFAGPTCTAMSLDLDLQLSKGLQNPFFPKLSCFFFSSFLFIYLFFTFIDFLFKDTHHHSGKSTVLFLSTTTIVVTDNIKMIPINNNRMFEFQSVTNGRTQRNSQTPQLCIRELCFAAG